MEPVELELDCSRDTDAFGHIVLRLGIDGSIDRVIVNPPSTPT